MPAVSAVENIETPNNESAAQGAESSASVNDIASTLAESMPEIQPHAIEKGMQEASQQQQNAPKFDPTIHAANADGSPKLKADGSFALKRGRKSGSPTSKVAQPSNSTSMPQMSESEASARMTGSVCAQMIVQLGVNLGGDEWLPRKDTSIGLDEMAQLESAFGNYFNAKGFTDIPPGAALAMALAFYTLPRLTMPKTRTRIGRAKDWIVAKFVQYKARKAGARVNVEAQ